MNIIRLSYTAILVIGSSVLLLWPAKVQAAPGGKAMATSAKAFLESLTPDQRTSATCDFDDARRISWHYVPLEKRKGISLEDMDSAQRELAMNVLKTATSETGYEKAAITMQLDAIIRHFEPSNTLRDPELYYFTVYGSPAGAGCWGLSIEGHHLSLNYVIQDGRIICATPLFIGANPARVIDNAGTHIKPGTHILRAEEELAAKLIRSLTPEQKEAAIITEKSPMDMREGHKSQTSAVDPQGIAAAKLNIEQKQILQQLIETVLKNAPAEIASPSFESVTNELDEISIAWMGSTKADEPHSCRVLGPSLLILFYKTQSDASGNPVNHTHVLWRTPGKDFGVNTP
jgi:hypothetical protein